MNIFFGFVVLSLMALAFLIYSSTIPYTSVSSTIFLIIVLVTGTIALSSPSFMTGVSAQSQPYYGIDKNRKLYGIESYEPTEYPSYSPKC